MSDRDAIEAGAQALYNMHPEEYRKPISERHDGDAEHTEAAAVYFAAQDIIRADERADLRERIAEAIEAKADDLDWARGHEVSE